MKKFFVIVSMVIFSIICSLLVNCGLEDIASINAVTDIDFYGTDDNFVASSNNLEHVFYNLNDGWVRFRADNQEYERKNAQEFYLIVGYDIYYSVTSGSSFRKANVFDPFLTRDTENGYHDANATLYDMRTELFPDGSNRFPSRYFNSDYDDFYTKTTFPILLDMVYCLDDTDYNVQFCFFDSPLNDSTNKNPFIYNDSVRLENVYPSFDEYEASWYKKMRDNDEKFKGFYDYRYYKKKGVTPYDQSGNNDVYKVWFYVVAKGFNSADEVDRISNYNESVKSATKECYFLVDRNVDTSYVD